MKKIDTHFHTKLSDWSRTNNDVLKESREKWINFISATEHDIINDELSLLANMNWLSNSLWVEISAVDNEVTWKSLHLTCYSDHFCDEIRSILENTREKRKIKIMKQVEKLESLWFNINYEKFIRFYKNLDVNIDNINNFHIEDYIFQNEDNIDRFLLNLVGFKINRWDFISRCLKKWWDLNYIWWEQIEPYEPSVSKIWELVNDKKYFLSLRYSSINSYRHNMTIQTYILTVCKQ